MFASISSAGLPAQHNDAEPHDRKWSQTRRPGGADNQRAWMSRGTSTRSSRSKKLWTRQKRLLRYAFGFLSGMHVTVASLRKITSVEKWRHTEWRLRWNRHCHRGSLHRGDKEERQSRYLAILRYGIISLICSASWESQLQIAHAQENIPTKHIPVARTDDIQHCP
jgi:hypothetical protein